MHLPNLPFVVLDTETTGFIPKVNRIIEYAGVRIENGEITDEYETLCSIPTEIPGLVSMLTRIRDEDLQGKPTFEEILPEILKRIPDDAIIVGQNVGFDIRMLKGEECDLSNRPWIDTSMIASLVFPEFESYSLGYMSKVLNLNHEPVHRALGDVRATIELLEHCWKRLVTLPDDHRDALLSIMHKAPEGYRRLFSELPTEGLNQLPTWLTLPGIPSTNVHDHEHIQLQPPQSESVQLVEAPLDPEYVHGIIAGALDNKESTTWIAVKNVDHALKLFGNIEGVNTIRPPYQLLNTENVESLASKETFSADEATLATKLAWYEEDIYSLLPIHGDERSVWKGRLACSEKSERYAQQFIRNENVVLIDHWQLLRILADPSHPGAQYLARANHVIIDDASMLEDTATKAHGWYCSTDDLRGAADTGSAFERVVDILQIWVERTRQSQDTVYITPADVGSTDAKGVYEQLSSLLSGEVEGITPSIRQQIEDLQKILTVENLPGRISWIEQKPNGSIAIQSVPERVGAVLKEHLYSAVPTTLLIPLGSDTSLSEILPSDVTTTVKPAEDPCGVQMITDEEMPIASLIENPLPGKTVLLIGSRARIEQIYVEYTLPAEDNGITLICQGLNGGMGRMQAEFLAADAPAIWVMTPWMFEGVFLEPSSIDHLILGSVPFDHPSHTVISKRSEHFRNAFEQYSLPRAEHRLYRILRTFKRFASASADAYVTDERLQKKSYGKRLLGYLRQFATEEAVNEGNEEDQMKLF